MKTSFAALFALCASVVVAQNTTGLPECSLSCFTTAVSGSGCSQNDTLCQCTTGADYITKNATSCITEACSVADQQQALTATKSICAAAEASASASASGSSSGSASATSSAGSSTTSSPALRLSPEAVGASCMGVLIGVVGLLMV